MEYKFAFERLEVWQLARQFFRFAYETIDTFPQCEKFNLVDQIRRASTSIALNLAEMTSRSSLKEQAHYFPKLHTVQLLKFIVHSYYHTI